MSHRYRRFSILSRLLILLLLWMGLTTAAAPAALANASISSFWTAPAPTNPWAEDISAADIFTSPDEQSYQFRPFPSQDGIGKIYMGREIAQVMGHQGAGWLERPNRATTERPHKFIEALGIKPTDVIADIGAGTGFISFRLAALVPEGKVLAVDVQPEMLDIVEKTKARRQIPNVETTLGTQQSPNLAPESIDLAVMVDAYHEFAFPREMMEEIITALKPDGRVVLVEYKAENPLIFIKELHKMSQKQVRKEMQAVGLHWQGNKQVLPQQHVMIFGKAQPVFGMG